MYRMKECQQIISLLYVLADVGFTRANVDSLCRSALQIAKERHSHVIGKVHLWEAAAKMRLLRPALQLQVGVLPQEMSK